MSKETKIIKDPFMGEIELEKVGQTSLHAVGESRMDTIYSDKKGNFWIETTTTFGSDGMFEPEPMLFIRKGLVDLITEINQFKFFTFNKDE
tara:strand:- start:230 stop:502 length:273 start_codon:yes stop_codon:yes gene_type:complete